MRPTLNHITVSRLVVDAEKGVRFDQCMKSALLLSLAECRVVELVWNASRYLIDGDKIVGRLCNDSLPCNEDH